MPQPKFLYNLKSLRFEKAGFPWRWVIINGLGLAFMVVLFFAGLLYLQNRIVESPLEKQLRWENDVLTRHKKVIEEESARQNVQMASLAASDKALHKRILLTDPAPPEKSEPYSKSILAGDFSDFYNLLDKLSAKTSASFKQAGTKNYLFSRLYWPGKKDVEEIRAFPTLAPVADFKIDQLVCGFGNQINPFNKLLYEHKGLDISGEKGTDVVASGSGVIESAVFSETPSGLGNYVSINHGNGYVTRYAHLQKISVYRGQKIKQGQSIGTLGMSGGVVAPHLHYEIIRNGIYYNPALFMIEESGVENFMSLAEIGTTSKQALD
jgi:murein DD-endopeptidase MepM/ murein hydrolase activator NlpD